MPATGYATALPRTRATLLSSCAVASALVVAGQALPARAQALVQGYNGTITDSTNYFRSNEANQAVIKLDSSNTSLTWTPTVAAEAGTGSVNFQSAGATTTFVGPNGGGDYAVLNRIIPTDQSRSITFNGTTLGRLGDDRGQAAGVGGKIWFYSPGGIIASGTSRFDVGSLLLSANEIRFEGGYGSEGGYGVPNDIFFSGNGGSSAVEIRAGAQLLAGGAGNNYVALVAPRVVQGGSVTASQTAYVAADTGDMTSDMSVNNGLFSFAVTLGSGATDALRHTGTTTLTGTGADHRAFIVAVPRNNAITALVGGTVAYANAVSVQDGAIILSSGNISDGVTPQALNANADPLTEVSGTTAFVIGDVSDPDGTVSGNGARFTSIFANSRGSIATQGGFTVTGDVSLTGGTSVRFGGDGADVSIVPNTPDGAGGNLDLTSFIQSADGSRTGGTTELYALNGAAVRIAGNVTIAATGQAQTVRAPLIVPTEITPPAGIGGDATVTVTNATLTTGLDLTIRADGTGLAGGTGVGGRARLVLNGGTVAVGAAGTGYGELVVSANGTGGGGTRGGDGFGGQASITALATRQSADETSVARITVETDTTVSANGQGGGAGAAGTGGDATVTLGDGTITPFGPTEAFFTGDALAIRATGYGGAAGSGANGAGGAGTGGTARLRTVLADFTTASLDASGTGTAGFSTSDSGGGTGGAGIGGFVDVDATNSLSRGNLSLLAFGQGGAGGRSLVENGYGTGAGGAGGTGIGGRASLYAAGVGIAFGDAGSALSVDASARGGSGGGTATGNGGAGGEGRAGISSRNLGTAAAPLAGGAYVTFALGRSDYGDITVRADGTGGGGGGTTAGRLFSHGAGGNGFGGDASMRIIAATDTQTTGARLISAQGAGGAAATNGSGAAGSGSGGSGYGGGYAGTAGGAVFSVMSGFASNGASGIADLGSGTLTVTAGATGTGGLTAGGDAIGGRAAMDVQDRIVLSSRPAARITLAADATGGAVLPDPRFVLAGGTGGNATGGVVTFTATGFDTLPLTATTTATLALSANAVGGGGTSGSSVIAGGSGTGGSATFGVVGPADVTVPTSLDISATGIGGAGRFATGGAGTGGIAAIAATGGRLQAGSLRLDASALGGTGSGENAAFANFHDGGSARGGTAAITLGASSAGRLPSVTVSGTTTLIASGTGGAALEGGYGANGFVRPGSGGAGSGGNMASGGGAYVDVQSGTATLLGLSLDAGGTGGTTAAGGTGGPGRGGDATVSVATGGESGATLSATGITIVAGGTGGAQAPGYGSVAVGGDGGSGIGGRASLLVGSQAGTATAGGTVSNTGATLLNARGIGQAGSREGSVAAGDGGSGRGGSAGVTLIGSTLRSGALTVASDGTGGFGGAGLGPSGAGGDGTGGGSSVSATRSTVTIDGDLTISTIGTGGTGGTGFSNREGGGNGGSGYGGTADLLFTDGSLAPVAGTTAGLRASFLTTGIGGSGGGTDPFSGNTETPLGGSGGVAGGGAIRMRADGTASIGLGTFVLTSAALGGNGADRLAGGGATAGAVTIVAGGTIRATAMAATGAPAAVSIDASAVGGIGGGSARGGAVQVSTVAGGRFDDDMLLNISATGQAGTDGYSGTTGGTGGGAGGDAFAGALDLSLERGTIAGLTVIGFAEAGRGGNASEAGYGGAGGAGGAGGNAGGGPVAIAVSGAGTAITVTSAIDLHHTAGSGGSGGSGADGPAGGDGSDATREFTEGGVEDTPATDGADGGDGGTGGTGGAGGDATAAAVSITARDGGRIAFAAGRNNGFDLRTTGGDAGRGGDGGAGGQGGRGGAGLPATDDGTAPELPAGADGGQGAAGNGGDAGIAGQASGSLLTILASGGTIALGRQAAGEGGIATMIDTSATGGDGASGGVGGAGDLPGGTGISSANANGAAGDVTLRAEDAGAPGARTAGRIDGGALSILAIGLGGSGDNTDGRGGIVSLVSAGSSTADAVPLGAISLGSLTVTSLASRFAPAAPGGVSGATIRLGAENARFSVAGSVTLTATDNVALTTTGSGRFVIGGGLAITSAADVLALRAAATDPASLQAARIDISAAGDATLDLPLVATGANGFTGAVTVTAGKAISATNIGATDAILLRGGTGVGVGTLTTTAAADRNATDLATAGGGTIDIVAGETDFTVAPDPATALANDAGITVSGTLSAANAIRLRAGGSVTLAADTGAAILSGNLLRIDAGNDIRIGRGATLRSGLAPIAETDDTGSDDTVSAAGLFLTAGRVPRIAPNPDPADIASITIAGTLTSGVLTDGALAGEAARRRPISIIAQAVQADAAAIAGRSLAVAIDGAPLPGAMRSNDGTLSADCVQGDVCLGIVDTTDRLTIGGFTGAAAVPTFVRIAGASANRSTVIRSQGDITLGTAAATTRFAASDLLRVQSTAGAVILTGDTVLSGGTAPAEYGGLVQVLGETGIRGTSATIDGGGVVGLYGGSGDIVLGSLLAGSLNGIAADLTVTTPDGLNVPGSVTIADRLAVSDGDARIAARSVSIGRAEVSDGFAIDITATNGDATLRDATAGPLGTAGTIVVAASGGTATLLAATSSGGVTVSGTAGAVAGTVAGFDIDVVSQTGAASLTNGTATRDIRLSAGTAATIGSAGAGDDITVAGATVAIGTVATTGNFIETGYGGDGSNIRVASLGALSLSGIADAHDGLSLTSESGAIIANILTAGDDVIATGATLAITSATARGTTIEGGYGASGPAGSNVVLTAFGAGAADPASLIVATATAARDVTLAATGDGGSIRAGTIAAGRDVTADAPGAVQVATGATAGRDILLSAGLALNAGALRADGDIILSGDTVELGSATTTGRFADTDPGADGSNIRIAAARALVIRGTADAFGDLDLTSGNGTITAGILTAGDDVTVSGARLALRSVASRGGGESGYGGAADGSNIMLTAFGDEPLDGPALLVGDATAFDALTLRATGANGSVDATALAAGGGIGVAANGAVGIVGGIAGGGVSVRSGAALDVGSLTAGGDIVLAALGDVTLGSAIANGPAIASSDPFAPAPVGGLVSITAGRAGDATPLFAAADLTITGTVRANGHVRADAGRDIVVAAGGLIASANRVTLNAGDDIRIAAGGEVRAATAPLPATIVDGDGAPFLSSPAALALNAGALPLGYTAPAGNVAAVIVDGTVSAAARPLTIAAGAVQADRSVLAAGSLAITITGAPAAGAAQSDDGGQLRAECAQGNVCLGAVALAGFMAGSVTVPGALDIGGTQAERPTNVRVAGTVTAASIAIAARDGIFLGTDGTAIAQTAAGAVSLDAGAGSVNLLGPLVLTGGDAAGGITIRAADRVTGAAAGLVSRGGLDVAASNGVVLASTGSAGATRVATPAGGITIGSAAVATGDLNLSARDTIGLGSGTAGDSILLASANDAVNANILNAGSAPGAAGYRGLIAITANGGVTITTADAATDITVSAGPDGGAAIGTARAATGDLNVSAGRAVAITNGSAGNSVLLASSDDAVNAGALNAGSAPGAAGYRGLIAITANSGVTITAADAATDITVSAGPDGGAAIGTARAASGNLAISGGGAIDIASGVAGDSILLGSTGGNVRAGTLAAGGVPEAPGYRGLVAIGADTGVTIGSATAATDIRIVARDTITTGTLVAGGNGLLLADGDVTTGAVTAGQRFIVAGRQTASLLSEDLDPASLDGRVPVATTGTVTFDGPVTAGSVVVAAGDAVRFDGIAAATTVSLGSARGGITGRRVTAGSGVSLAAAGDVMIREDASAGSGLIDARGASVTLTGASGLAIGMVEATAGDIGLATTAGTIDVRSATASGNLNAAAAEGLTIASLSTGGSAILSGRSLTLGTAGTGGDARLATAGLLVIDRLIAGGAIDAGSTGSAIRAGTLDANGDITLNAVDALTFGSARSRAGGVSAISAADLRFGSVDAAGDVTLAAAGALDRIDDGSIVAGGSIAASTGLDLVLGTLAANADLTLQAGGALAIVDATATGGTLTLTAGRTLGVSGIARAGGGIVATGGEAVTIANGVAGGAIDVTSRSGAVDAGTLSARGGLRLTAAGALDADDLAATGDITLDGSTVRLGRTDAGGGLAIAADDAIVITADIRAGRGTAGRAGNVTAAAGGDIRAGAIDATGLISLAGGGSITTASLAAGGGITARASGNLFVRDAVAASPDGDIVLAGGYPFGAAAGAPYLATGGATITGTVSAARTVRIEAGGGVTVAATGRVRSDGTVGLASGGDVVIEAGGTIGQSFTRSDGPADALTIAAGSLRGGTPPSIGDGPASIRLNGTADGVSIAFTSEAIDIGGAAQVGSGATRALAFTNGGSGTTTIGGGVVTSGYGLSDAALRRTRSAVTDIVAPGDVTVQTLGLTGSAASGGNLVGNAAAFTIRTPGAVDVRGAVTLTQAGRNDLFAITAGNRITVFTPDGSIALSDADGALAGRIGLAAPRIIVATAAAGAALDGLATPDARDQRLGANDGVASDTGFLRADGLEFRVGNGLYIQNSGTGLFSTARRGFTAGSGGVAIVTTGANPAEIVINGRVVRSDGTFAGGRTLIPLLSLSGGGQATMARLDPRSTANGCLIVGQSCRFDTVPTQPVQDIIDQLLRGQDSLIGAISSVVQQFNSPLVELIDFTPFRLSGIIEEPVTGAGNDDFYASFGGEDGLPTGGTLGEQITGTGNDNLASPADDALVNKGTLDEQVTGSGNDNLVAPPDDAPAGRATLDQQVTGSGKDDLASKADGRCDPQAKKDPDCR